MDASIVVPVHNAQAHLGACLAAVRALEGDFQVEVLCVDDGSTDATPDLLAQAAQEDPRVRVLRQPARGVSAARNAGLAEAVGEYVLFVDADDLVDPQLLCSVLPVAHACQAQMTVFGFEEYYEQAGTSFPREMCEEAGLAGRAFSPDEVAGPLTEVTTPNVWRICWQRAFMENAGLRFHEDLRTAEDLAIIHEALLAAQRVALVPQRLYKYRRDGGTTLTREDRQGAGFAALAHVWEYGQARGLFTPQMQRQFANVVADTAEYALWSAATYDEFARTFEAYKQQWDPFVQQHAAQLAPRYQGFCEAVATQDAQGYLWRLYTQRREWYFQKEAECATQQRRADEACARAEAAAQDAAAVRASRSYRIGNALVRPFAALFRGKER